MNNLIQSKLEEFDKIVYHDSGDEYDNPCDILRYEKGECNCQIKEIKQFISQAMEEAYKAGEDNNILLSQRGKLLEKLSTVTMNEYRRDIKEQINIIYNLLKKDK